MKKDSEVEFYMQQRRKGLTQSLAAGRAGMSECTARKYEKAQALVLSDLRHFLNFGEIIPHLTPYLAVSLP